MREFSIPAMAATILIAALSACAPQRATPSVTAGTPASPSITSGTDAEFTSLIATGTRVGLSAIGDLDADGDDDALLVLEGKDANAPRALLLLRRGADGRLQTAVESRRAILCPRCGGMAGDPLQGVRIESGGFILRFEGGSRELWSSEFGFAYASGIDQWQLRRVVHAGFDRADGNNAERALTQEEIGDVRLVDFDASDFPADALP